MRKLTQGQIATIRALQGGMVVGKARALKGVTSRFKGGTEFFISSTSAIRGLERRGLITNKHTLTDMGRSYDV